MAEILIRIVDRVSGDKELEPVESKRSDVVVICDDGWPWSVEERTNPNWRIIRSNILNTHIVTLHAGLPAETLIHSSQRSRRSWKLDLDSLPPPIRAKFVGRRTDEIIDIPPGIIVAATVKK